MKKRTFIPILLIFLLLAVSHTAYAASATNEQYINQVKTMRNVKIMLPKPHNCSLVYATAYNRIGMSRNLDLYAGNSSPYFLYRALKNGRVCSVQEPETAYGPLFETENYYREEYIIGFYTEYPTYDKNSGEPPTNAGFSFVIYAMGEGEPEFGEDSKFLIYDVQTQKWYILDGRSYGNVLKLLQNSEPETLFSIRP